MKLKSAYEKSVVFEATVGDGVQFKEYEYKRNRTVFDTFYKYEQSYINDKANLVQIMLFFK